MAISAKKQERGVLIKRREFNEPRVGYRRYDLAASFMQSPKLRRGWLILYLARCFIHGLADAERERRDFLAAERERERRDFLVAERERDFLAERERERRDFLAAERERRPERERERRDFLAAERERRPERERERLLFLLAVRPERERRLR